MSVACMHHTVQHDIVRSTVRLQHIVFIFTFLLRNYIQKNMFMKARMITCCTSWAKAARRLNCFLFTMLFLFSYVCACHSFMTMCTSISNSILFSHWYRFATLVCIFLLGEPVSVTWEVMNGSNLKVIDVAWHVTDTTISACLWLLPGLPWQPERQCSGFILYGTLAGVWRAVFLCLLQLCLYTNHRCKCLRPRFVTL